MLSKNPPCLFTPSLYLSRKPTKRLSKAVLGQRPEEIRKNLKIQVFCIAYRKSIKILIFVGLLEKN